MSGRKNDIETLFVHLCQFWGDGRASDAEALMRQVLPRIASDRPDLGDSIRRAIAKLSGVGLARSVQGGAIPSDRESKQDLARVEAKPALPMEPVWAPEVRDVLETICAERMRASELAAAGIGPTRTLLFVGAPGVGKTLAARWLALNLGKPLVTLDLAAVMSSLLGRTGSNIRSVLDYAVRTDAVLLLDEFDSIAKRRDDVGDVGELKRLVNVLLQAIDEWPSGGLLIAATNHPELLDPAVWRRFERVVQFPVATAEQAREILKTLLADSIGEDTLEIAASVFEGRGLADATREVAVVKRESIVRNVDVQDVMLERIRILMNDFDKTRRMKVSSILAKRGLTQRAIKEITGISRDTLRANGIGTVKVQKKRKS